MSQQCCSAAWPTLACSSFTVRWLDPAAALMLPPVTSCSSCTSQPRACGRQGTHMVGACTAVAGCGPGQSIWLTLQPARSLQPARQPCMLHSNIQLQVASVRARHSPDTWHMVPHSQRVSDPRCGDLSRMYEVHLVLPVHGAQAVCVISTSRCSRHAPCS